MDDKGWFDIETDPYGEGIPLFGKDHVELMMGATSLVGCNGSGKTTLMRLMREQVESRRDDSAIIWFDAKEEPRRRLNEFGYVSGDAEMVADVATILSSSEGEGMTASMAKLARRLGTEVSSDRTNDLWLFIDSADSGLDAPSLRMLVDLLETVSDDLGSRGRRLYAVIASNSFEPVRYAERCILVPSLASGAFDSYDEWYAYIEETSKKKEARYLELDKHDKRDRKDRRDKRDKRRKGGDHARR